MGVPSYFRELVKKYRYLITDSINVRVNNLYIDANCLFHPQCFKILDKFITLDGEELTNKMIERIITYMNYIINYINPSNIVYIAVDGVAPLAKITQQRRRRFGYANNYKQLIYKKYNIPINDKWSNIVISPGTEFMYKLHNAILNYYVTNANNKKYNIIYDSYLTPGEGEHKILRHIRKNCDGTNGTVVYGLDADLIFLTMSSKIAKIFLLRESSIFNEKESDANNDVAEEKLIFVNIDEVKKSIAGDMRCEIINTFKGTVKKMMSNNDIYVKVMQVPNQAFINDYIFICYFLGNDFLPHLPSLDINIRGIDLLLSTYYETFIFVGDNLIKFDKNISINMPFLSQFVSSIGNHETKFFTSDLHNFIFKNQNKKCNEYDQYKREIWEIENLKNINVADNVMLGEGEEIEWKIRYYSHYFNTFTHIDNTVCEVCHNYMEGLMWVTKYYFEECPTWQWQYNYNHAPFLSDVALHLHTIDINKDINLEYKPPIDMCVQLVAIVPPAFYNILPKELQHLSTSENSQIIDMFPISYDVDMLYKTKLYKCIPIIPYLDTSRIESAIKKCKFDTQIPQMSQIEPIYIKSISGERNINRSAQT